MTTAPSTHCAVIAREGLGANLPEDAVYASTSVDADGEPLIGGRNYAIDLPVDMPGQRLLVDHRLRPARNLLPGDAATLSVSGEAGTDRGASWCPRPRRMKPTAGCGFLRRGGSGCSRGFYWPEPEVLGNQWTYPPVRAQ